MPLSTEEREFAEKLLKDSLSGLKHVVASLTAEQLTHHLEGGWTPLAILAHLYVVEVGILRRLPNSPPPEILRKDRDLRIIEILRNRSRRMEAPERLVPDGRVTDLKELLEKLDRAREISLTWLADPTVDPRAHAMEHPFLKTLDGYQWLLMIAAHMERHTEQIAGIKASLTSPVSPPLV
jgi:hypothetical protein